MAWGTNFDQKLLNLIAPCIVVDVLHEILISFAQIWLFIVIFFPRIGWWDLCQHIFSILSHDDCAFWHIGWSYQGLLKLCYNRIFLNLLPCLFAFFLGFRSIYLLGECQKHISVKNKSKPSPHFPNAFHMYGCQPAKAVVFGCLSFPLFESTP